MQSICLVSTDITWIESMIQNSIQNLQIANENIIRISDNESLKIGAVRDLKHELIKSSFLGGNRLCVIYHADTGTEEAQNALLKILEEPPNDTTIMITAAQEHLLLPTICSRCNIIRATTQMTDVPDLHKTIYTIVTSSKGQRILLAQQYASTKDDATSFLSSCISYAQRQLIDPSDASLFPIVEWARLIKKLQFAQTYIRDMNINVKATMDILFLGFPSKQDMRRENNHRS